MEQVRFGVGISTSADAGADPVAAARAAEELGYDFVSCSDHPGAAHPSFEAWTLMTWVAAATERIGVLTRVLGVPFRPPAVVAKMAESLDRLSGGRLTLGLGAGALPAEIGALGLPVHGARARADGLADAVQIIRGLWSERAFTFSGVVHRVEAAELEPKPSHRIPIWLGTFGPRALALTGRLADGWIPSLDYAGADRLPGMREQVLAAAAAAGRRPEDVTCALNLVIGLDEHADPDRGRVVGPAAYVADRLRGLVDQGFTTFNLIHAGDPADLARVAAEVVLVLRGQPHGGVAGGIGT